MASADGVLLVLERDDRHHRPEDLLAGQAPLGIGRGHHGRREPEAGALGDGPAGDGSTGPPPGSPMPAPRKPATLARWAAVTSGPISVAGSVGIAHLHAATASASSAR